jgi:hypothetical protein
VVGEAGWAVEDFNHFLELGPVSGKAGAIGHTGLDGLQEISKLFHTSDNFISTSSFEVCVGGFSICEDVFGISNAGVDIIEVLGVESTLEDTLNDSDKLESVKFNLFRSFGSEFNLFLDPFRSILDWVLVVFGPLVDGVGVLLVKSLEVLEWSPVGINGSDEGEIGSVFHFVFGFY